MYTRTIGRSNVMLRAFKSLKHWFFSRWGPLPLHDFPRTCRRPLTLEWSELCTVQWPNHHLCDPGQSYQISEFQCLWKCFLPTLLLSYEKLILQTLLISRPKRAIEFSFFLFSDRRRVLAGCASCGSIWEHLTLLTQVGTITHEFTKAMETKSHG